MTKKCIKIPFVEEITGKPGASVRFVDQHTVPLDTTVQAACEGLFVIGQPQLVKNNFLGLFKSMADGVQRDGKPRKLADFIRVFPVFTGAVDLDRGFDPKTNDIRLGAELLNEMKLDVSKWSFEDVTEGRKPIRIESVTGSGRDLVDAEHDVAINGHGLAETHAVELRLEGGEAQRVDPAHVSGEISRMDVDKVALASLNSPENDGKALTITVRGNFAKASKTVTFRYAEPVDPTAPRILNVRDGSDESLIDTVHEGGGVISEGVNLSGVTAYRMRYVKKSGETATVEYDLEECSKSDARVGVPPVIAWNDVEDLDKSKGATTIVVTPNGTAERKFKIV